LQNTLIKKNLILKVSLLLVISSLIWMFFYLDLNRYFSLSNLKDGLYDLDAFCGQHQMLSMVIYFAIFLFISTLSLPASGITILAGGALFGHLCGTVLASFASAIGGTLAFLLSRYMFRDWVQNRFPDKLAIINRGIEKEGGFYLFTIRLVAVFPFFVVNPVMGLTNIRVAVFYLVSQIGMLPVIFIFINAGTQLAAIESPRDVLSLNIILSFAILGIFPIVAKRFTEYLRARFWLNR
jgi:uncharacterized membrane protein YdjX (TVP38/TMEM64 family)